MNNASSEFNRKLELDVLITDMSEVTCGYVQQFDTDNLSEVIIPNGVEKLGKYAFGWCDSLTSIEIPDSVTEIEAEAFCGCRGLTSLTIPASVTDIGGSAFIWCDSLKSITIPASVKTIGVCAFWNCNNLNNVTFKGKTLDEVRSMLGYPWGIRPEKISVQV